ncbi:MAG TPA: glycosyl hydrolase [Syntrophomonadaceae bacterium]|nr:glycosyl hydrolase [Syntrophomonadaceae bacterium]HPR93308.1 glycosyl hydrolase [Syntrophomonadaceae bacterium]
MKKLIFAFTVCLIALLAFEPLLPTALSEQVMSPDPLESEPAYITYTNLVDGYQINYPAHMQIDDSLPAIGTVISDDKTRIEIYYDDFTGSDSVISAYSYINYANRFKQNTKYHQVLEDRYFPLNGFNAHILKWYREKLPAIPDDKNHYLCAEIIKNPREVYTIFFKSSEPINDYMKVLNSFTLREISQPARVKFKFAPLPRDWNEETMQFYQDYFVDNQQLNWGLFEHTAPEDNTVLNKIEDSLNYHFPLLLKYQMLDNPFPLQALQTAYDNNRYVELTLQTFWLRLSDSRNEEMVYEILEGKYDLFFLNYAQKLKTFGHPVLFRLNNEMNGDWCKYSAYYTCKDPEIFKAMWRHIYNIFAAEGVDNVLWVWNPNDISFPDFKINHALAYYPGDQYVDIVGLTGYNTGNYYTGEKWREFEAIYEPLYQTYSSYFSHPFIITEFASNSVGGDKAAWVKNMFTEINQYPQIKAAIWWNGTDWDDDMHPARIYRLDENKTVLDTFRMGLSKQSERPASKAELNQALKTDLINID